MAAGGCDGLCGHPAELHSYYGVVGSSLLMSVYVHQGGPCVRKSCYECSCHEVVCLRIRAKNMNFYVFAVYRNPGADGLSTGLPAHCYV